MPRQLVRAPGRHCCCSRGAGAGAHQTGLVRLAAARSRSGTSVMSWRWQARSAVRSSGCHTNVHTCTARTTAQDSRSTCAGRGPSGLACAGDPGPHLYWHVLQCQRGDRTACVGHTACSDAARPSRAGVSEDAARTHAMHTRTETRMPRARAVPQKEPGTRADF